ncbi:hypothetical protein AWB80_04247 [Caballeronia pedi]|uniref:Glycosyltransferase RgtA/B/C/D-like domain-containing protein n=1 Tax=Caballeronia pedi TaxID=1777141 RepID=A0A158BX04_9BURK|nr:hypothetical protein [Caballeronia pedi]SAK74605.1 hypothetical protein AWB80_04247 [Caballeronia pedi]
MSENLCPSAGERARAPSSLAADIVLTYFIVVVLLLYRMPERLQQGYLWAEDATVFIGQAYKFGAHSILMPYAGYLHVIPRLVAFTYRALGADPQGIAIAFAWTCALLTASVCSYLYAIAVRYVPRPAAFVIALAPVLLPHTGESWLNLTNLQWTLGPLLMVMLLDTLGREHSDHLFARCFIVLVLAFTGPFSAILVPLAVPGALVASRREKGLRRLAPFLIVLVAGLTQLAIYKFANDRHPQHPLSEYFHYPWIETFLNNFVMESLFVPQVLPATGDSSMYAALATLVIFLACVLSPAGRWRAVNIIALAMTVALWMLGVVRNDAPAVAVQWFYDGVARYTFTPFVLCIWALAIAAAKSPLKLSRYVAVAFLVLLFANGATRFHAPTMPSKITVQPDGAYLIEAAPGSPWHTTVKPGR